MVAPAISCQLLPTNFCHWYVSPDAVVTPVAVAVNAVPAFPPAGDKAHRYIFTVHALDIESLGLDKNSTPALVGYMLNSHTIAKASIISYYQR